jgi:hypothetical protein
MTEYLFFYKHGQSNMRDEYSNDPMELVPLEPFCLKSLIDQPENLKEREKEKSHNMLRLKKI